MYGVNRLNYGCFGALCWGPHSIILGALRAPKMPSPPQSKIAPTPMQEMFHTPLQKIQNVSYPRCGFQKMFRAPLSRKNGKMFHTPIWTKETPKCFIPPHRFRETQKCFRRRKHLSVSYSIEIENKSSIPVSTF